MAVKIVSTVKNGEVYVRCSDIIASLYEDSATTDDSTVKSYINAAIVSWRQYDNDILEKAGNK
jgi:hypothetical protein